MPNTGRPSPDCNLCRLRRVKCDLTRPACRRCLKYGAECPGYRSQIDLRFRTFTVSQLAKRSKKLQSVDGDSPASAYALSPPRIVELQQPWEELSVPLVLHRFHGFHVLQGIFENSQSDQGLTLAARLVARTLLYEPVAVASSVKDSQSYLSPALRAVRNAIQDSSTGVTDSTLATVWLLCIYETLVGSIERIRSSTNPWHVHSHGLFTLLRVRGVDQLSTDQGRRMFWLVYNVIQMQSLISNQELPIESLQWLKMIQKAPREGEELRVTLAIYNQRAESILTQVLKLLVSANFHDAASKLPLLLGELDAAERNVADWLRENPRALLADSLKRDAFSRAALGSWRALRIKMYHFTIMLLNLVQYAPVDATSIRYDARFLEQRRHSSSCAISQAANDLVDWADEVLKLGSPPQSPTAAGGGRAREAGWLEALQMVLPLAIAYHIPTVPWPARDRARKALGIIGRRRESSRR